MRHMIVDWLTEHLEDWLSDTLTYWIEAGHAANAIESLLTSGKARGIVEALPMSARRALKSLLDAADLA